jgi:chromosomal replication initiation ATPase DnaA
MYGFSASGGTSIPPDITCALAARLAAIAFGVAATELVSSRRVSRQVSTARQIGMYLAHTAAGLSLTTVAGYFGRDRTTAAYACRLVEDRRDDKKFDAELTEIEDLLRAICGFGR